MKRKWFGLICVMVLVLTMGTLGSASTIVKDSGTPVPLATPPYIVAGELDEEVVIQLEALYGAGDYTGDRIYRNGECSVVSVIKDGDKIGWHLVTAGSVELFESEEHRYIFMNGLIADKITAELQQEMSYSSEALLPVYVWLEDIDTD